MQCQRNICIILNNTNKLINLYNILHGMLQFGMKVKCNASPTTYNKEAYLSKLNACMQSHQILYSALRSLIVEM